MKIGLLGGTFDPVHNAHVEMAQAALTNGGLDRLIIMPSGRPPHKSGEVVSLAGYRHEMACLAFGGEANIEISDLEIMRPGRSFTLDTILQLRTLLPADAELVLVFGSDILKEIEKWHEPAAVMAACPLLLASRGDVSERASKQLAESLASRFGARISFFRSSRSDLSSTMVREAIQSGKPWLQCVPEKVARFIQRNKLYHYQDDLSCLEPELWQHLAELERRIWPLLDKKRLLHSLNVMVYSLHLARIHAIDFEQTAVAALLHDCGKCLPKNEMKKFAALAGDQSLVDGELGHGPAGAWIARDLLGIKDEAVMRAILYHTTGCAGMTPLDKIIFIADKVEPARTYENLSLIRRLVETDLDGAMRVCLGEIDTFLKREQLPPHPYTKSARDDLAQTAGGQICYNLPKEQKSKGDKSLTAEQTANLIQGILEDKKAKNIEMIDVEGKTILADRFVIATGTSVTHVKALAGEVELQMKDQHHCLPDHIEGYSSGRWILLDYGDVVVHIFHSEEREFYSLEKLWRASRS